MGNGFGIVTELPGEKASIEQRERLFHRYHFARGFCEGRSVLEVGCGAGIGLGYLARVAGWVVGGDIDRDNLAKAWGTYRGRKGIDCGLVDAESLPFGDGSFDIVILFEAIYYLHRPEAFLNEARRVLRKGGTLILCTVNKDWRDFNASPLSRRYFSVPELSVLLDSRFQSVTFYGAFPGIGGTPSARSISLIKRCAISLGLIPRTMRGKALCKRLFFGRLVLIPAEIHGEGRHYVPPQAIPRHRPNREHKIIYAVATSATDPVPGKGS